MNLHHHLLLRFQRMKTNQALGIHHHHQDRRFYSKRAPNVSKKEHLKDRRILLMVLIERSDFSKKERMKCPKRHLKTIMKKQKK